MAAMVTVTRSKSLGCHRETWQILFQSHRACIQHCNWPWSSLIHESAKILCVYSLLILHLLLHCCYHYTLTLYPTAPPPTTTATTAAAATTTTSTTTTTTTATSSMWFMQLRDGSLLLINFFTRASLLRRSFRFQRFKLGRGVPQILGAEVSDAPCRSVERQGVELRVAFNLEYLDRTRWTKLKKLRCCMNIKDLQAWEPVDATQKAWV